MDTAYLFTYADKPCLYLEVCYLILRFMFTVKASLGPLLDLLGREGRAKGTPCGMPNPHINLKIL